MVEGHIHIRLVERLARSGLRENHNGGSRARQPMSILYRISRPVSAKIPLTLNHHACITRCAEISIPVACCTLVDPRIFSSHSIDRTLPLVVTEVKLPLPVFGGKLPLICADIWRVSGSVARYCDDIPFCDYRFNNNVHVKGIWVEQC